MEVSKTLTSPSRTVWTGTLLHKCHPLATLNAKTATGLACSPPETLHVQQKIQFEKFAAQLLPSTIQNKSTQLSCHMQHFDDGGRGFQPCVLSCEDDGSRKWSRFADFLHKDNSVGVATAEGRTLEDSKVCLFLIPALLLYPYLDARSSESSERLFGLFSWHLSEDSAKETKQLNPINEKIRHDASKVSGLENHPFPSQMSDAVTTPQSATAPGAVLDTHTTSCSKITEPISKKPPSPSTNICKPIAATLLQEVHIEEVSNSNQPSAEAVSVIKDPVSKTTTGSYKQNSKSTSRHNSYGLSYLTSSFKKSSEVDYSQKASNRLTKGRQKRSGSGKGKAQLKNDPVHVPQKGQMSGRNIAPKLQTTYKLSAVMMGRLLRTKHLQPMLKLKRIKHPPDPNKLASKVAKSPTPAVSNQSEFRNETNLEKSGSNSSINKRHLHIKRQPSASRISNPAPSTLSVPRVEALKSTVVKSPDVADFHDPFDCDMISQMSPDLNYEAVSLKPGRTTMDKHVANTFDINKHIKTANSGPIKSNSNTAKPAGSTRIPFIGRHNGVSTLAKDPRQVPLQQGPAVKIDMILPENDQSDYLENLITQDLQRMPYYDASHVLPSKDRSNKRKISYEDYVSKHPKIYPKVDSSQQTDLHVTRNMGTMARLRKSHRHASVQVNAPPETKDPVYELQQMAMKQSIMSALSALITRLRTGMTINTQITAILTLEKIIDIITKTARFDLEDKLKQEKSCDSLVFPDGGDRILTPSLPTYPLPGISNLTTGPLAGSEGHDTSKEVSVSENSTPSMVAPPKCKTLETEIVAQVSTTSSPSDCKASSPKEESAAESNMVQDIKKDSPDSPVPSSTEHIPEKTSDGRPSQITERKVPLGSALHKSEKITPNNCKTYPQIIESVAQTEIVHEIKDSPDSPDSPDSRVASPREHMAAVTSDVRTYQITERKVTIGSAPSPFQRTSDKMTDVSSSLKTGGQIAKLQTAHIETVVDSATKIEMHATCVKEDKMITSPAVDLKSENANMLHYASQTTTPDMTIHHRRDDCAYMKQPLNINGQPTVDGVPYLHSQESSPLHHGKLNNDQTNIISSQIVGEYAPVLPKPGIDDQTSYRSSLYKDSYSNQADSSSGISLDTSEKGAKYTNYASSMPTLENVLTMEKQSSRDKIPESGLRETSDTNYSMLQKRIMEDQNHRGRSLDTRFSQMGGSCIPVPANHLYSNVQGQQDKGVHHSGMMEKDSKMMSRMTAGSSKSFDYTPYVPAVYTNVHAMEEQSSRSIRLDCDHQRNNRDSNTPVSIFQRNDPANKEDTSTDRSIDIRQKEIQNVQNPYTFHGNYKPVDCSSYAPAVYTNVHANEENRLRGKMIEPSQIRTRDTEPYYSMVQRGNGIAIAEEDSRGRNLNQNESINTESPDNIFQRNFPVREEKIPRHSSLDLSHQEMRNTQNLDSMVHDRPKRVIELVHHDRPTYWPKYSEVQATELQHREINATTTDTFGGVHAQSAHSYYPTCINNQHRSQETKQKEEKLNSYATPNLENTFTGTPTMTVNGKPKRRVEIIFSNNDQQPVQDMGPHLNQEGSVTDTYFRCGIESAKTGEIAAKTGDMTSHNVQDLRNIIIQAQRLSAQIRDHKEDLLEPNEERTVQDATSQDLTGIKVTLRKKMPTDVKDTIAVINKCLHGSEDEERRFVMLGGQLPIRETQAEKVHSLEALNETSSADSTKQRQQNYVDQVQSKTVTTAKTVLQAGCDLISSDEENFNCAESYRDETRNPSKSTVCIQKEMHQPQDIYKRITHSTDATLQNCRDEAEHRNSSLDENRINNQPTNSSKPEYLKPSRVPHSTPPKAYQRISNHSRTTRKKPDPPSRTLRERYKVKTILEKQLNRFFAFVTSWKDGTSKSVQSLQDEAILWHKRMNSTCQSFRRIYDGKLRSGCSSLRWDGEVITMIEARLRLSQLNLASAMATYVTMSSVYEEIMKNYSKDGGRQQQRSRTELDELLSNTEKTLDAIRDAHEKYGSVIGIPAAWLTTISEMSSACVCKSETLKGLINEMENEQQQKYSGSRQYNGTEPDYIDELQTESDTLTNLLLNLAKLQELPPEELQQLEQYGLPEHVLKDCLQTIQGLDGSRMNPLDKEGANAASQSEFHREQPFQRTNAPQNDVHNPSQFHRDREEEDKSYKSIGYWHSKLKTAPSDKGRKRAHQLTRYDRENDVNKTRIRHIHKTATGELWTYHDKYEDSPGGYQAHYRQHVDDRNSLDRSSHNSSLEMSISSDEEHHYRRGNYNQREGWKGARDWKGKNRKIVHDENLDIPPWKRNKTGGRAMVAGVQNQNREPVKVRQFTNISSKQFAKGEEKNLMSKLPIEFKENDNCMATSNEKTDNFSFEAKEAPNEILQKNEETPHDILEGGFGVAQFSDQMHTADTGIENTHEEATAVLKPLAISITNQISTIDVSEIKLPVGFDEEQSPTSMTQQTNNLSLKGNPSVTTSNSTTQIHRPKISFTIGTGKQKIGGKIALSRKSMTEHSDTTEVQSADSDSKLKDLNQTSDSKPIKVPGHLTTKFGKLVSLNVVSNKSSNALKDIGVKYGGCENSDEAESSDATDSSEESGSDSSGSDSSDNEDSTSFPSHVLSDDASSSCSTPNKMLARSDQQTPLPVEGRKFLQILGNQSQKRVASAIEVPPTLRDYIDKTNFRVSMCPFGSDCRKGDSCWAAHDRSEIRKNLFKRLCIHELQDRTMWIDVDDAWRLNEFDLKLPVTATETAK